MFHTETLIVVQELQADVLYKHSLARRREVLYYLSLNKPPKFIIILKVRSTTIYNPSD